MATFLEDFKLFFYMIFELMTTFYNWLVGTIVGELILFIIIIGLFVGIIYLIIKMKD